MSLICGHSIILYTASIGPYTMAPHRQRHITKRVNSHEVRLGDRTILCSIHSTDPTAANGLRTIIEAGAATWLLLEQGSATIDKTHLHAPNAYRLPTTQRDSTHTVHFAAGTEALILQEEAHEIKACVRIIKRPFSIPICYHAISLRYLLENSSSARRVICLHLRLLLQHLQTDAAHPELRISRLALHQFVQLTQSPLRSAVPRFSTSQACQHTGLSRHQLSRLVQILFQGTAQEWLMGVKMTQACRLLAQQEVTLQYVSRRLQYRSADSFITAFKAYYGLTPHVYRKKIRHLPD